MYSINYKVDSLCFAEISDMLLKINHQVGNCNRRVSKCETYCDICDLTIGKRMFLSYGSASPMKRDPQTDVR